MTLVRMLFYVIVLICTCKNGNTGSKLLFCYFEFLYLSKQTDPHIVGSSKVAECESSELNNLVFYRCTIVVIIFGNFF